MTDFDYSHLVQAASELQQAWDAEGIRYCFIGGLAVQHWGEVRMTQDVDATISTGHSSMKLGTLADLKEEPEILDTLKKLHTQSDN